MSKMKLWNEDMPDVIGQKVGEKGAKGKLFSRISEVRLEMIGCDDEKKRNGRSEDLSLSSPLALQID